MKNQPRANTEVAVNLKKYSLETVRYAAHAASAAARVFIKLKGPATAVVEFSPTGKLPGPKIAAAFRAELDDETLRAKIWAANSELRDFMILKALSTEPARAQQDDSGLTPEQEKELDDLIAQVESEIKQEAAAGASADPLGITKTWEDKYGAKKPRKKN
ncbi:MAG: hypothetical protein HY952_11115 [Elusimicrobia bacterium]|nr:hypothetical protein [Elusimicrobiota bacterium]